MASFFPPGSGSSGGVTDVDFPLSGTGTGGDPLAIGPGLNTATIFASPLGDDSNDGLTWTTAVETGYVGYAKIVAAGGGYLNCADGTDWGGPVAGQGCWLRGDGLTVPGWQVAVPSVISFFGTGITSGFHNPFQQPGAGIMYAGDNSTGVFRKKPAIWVTRTENTVVFNNVTPRPGVAYANGHEGNFASFRAGWDYIRAEDGSINALTISSAERVNVSPGIGTTTLTTDLLPAITVIAAQRTSGVTLLTIPRPGTVKAPPWKTDTKFWFQSTDVNFTSGAYTVLATSANIVDDANWSIQFVDAHADTPVIAAPGTVRTNYAVLNDVIELESTAAQFPSTAYQVLSTSITGANTGTIAVVDRMGNGYNGVTSNAGPTANIGTLLLQCRSYMPALGTTFNNCAGTRTQNFANYTEFAPMYDFGTALAFSYEINDCCMDGLFPTVASGVPRDPLNHTSCLVQGEQIQSSSLRANRTTGHAANFLATIGVTTAVLELNDVVFDANDPSGECPGAYTIFGTDGGTLILNNIIVADAAVGYGGDLNFIDSTFPKSKIFTNQSLYGGVPTYNGSKFVAYDGFGTNSLNKRSVGGGSGQLTLTGTGTVYLPMYDADGTTIIGWMAMLQATVNP